MDNLFFLEAKCINTRNTFYIRFDKAAGGIWCQTYGVKHTPGNAAGNTYNKMTIDISQSITGPQYRCPHCGNTGYVRCGSCGKITCKPNNTKNFTCAHCGKTGVVNGRIKEIGGNSGTGQR